MPSKSGPDGARKADSLAPATGSGHGKADQSSERGTGERRGLGNRDLDFVDLPIDHPPCGPVEQIDSEFPYPEIGPGQPSEVIG